MTDIEKVKTLGKIEDLTDEQISLFLEVAEDEVLNYTNRDELIGKMSTVVIKYAIYLINESERANETSRNEGGVSVTYETEIPEGLKKQLNAYKLIPMIRLVRSRATKE